VKFQNNLFITRGPECSRDAWTVLNVQLNKLSELCVCVHINRNRLHTDCDSLAWHKGRIHMDAMDPILCEIRESQLSSESKCNSTWREIWVFFRGVKIKFAIFLAVAPCSVLWFDTNVSEDFAASIFRVEQPRKRISQFNVVTLFDLLQNQILELLKI